MADSYDISRNPSDLPKSKGVTSVRPGASRQHFLSFDESTSNQDTTHHQLHSTSWGRPNSIEDKQEDQVEDLFSTEINAEVYDRYTLESLLPTVWPIGKIARDTLKSVTDSHCSTFFEKAMNLFEKRTKYEEALIHINKCLLLKPFHLPFYEIRAEIYLNLCDFRSSSIGLQKIAVYNRAASNAQQATGQSRQSIREQQKAVASNPNTPAPVDERSVNNKLAFLRYISGVTIFDQKLYFDALGIVANGSSMFSTLPFQIYSILCLAALNKIDEATALVTQMIDQNPDSADLYIIRARLYFKDKTKLPLCYYDVRDALNNDPQHPLAIRMMAALHESAIQARDNCVRMSINERVNDALPSINLAIQLYPVEAEFHLQRSIIYRKMKKFEMATDECLLVFDKIGHDQQHKLYEQTQKQFVFIYNESAIRCLETGYHDDAIDLLNRAIHQEKNMPELYINRGDCFLVKGQITFALQDYEQAFEMAPDNHEIQIRISNLFFNNAEKLYKEKQYQESCKELTRAIKVNPSVAKFYVSRSRLKFLTDDIQGAREDIIAAIMINPLEEGCIDVLPRLFADTTLSDVLRSSLAKNVKENLLKQNVRLAVT